jgi:site-specific DNA-methyltransferase (adenine-specific)
MDCTKGMNSLAHETIDLVFADPPYNLGVDYGNGASVDRRNQYYDWCFEWLRATERILVDGGAFYLLHYPEECADLLPRIRALGLSLQRWIIWHYHTNIGQSANNWTRSHRAILFFTKGDKPRYFDGLADPQPYKNLTDKRIQENLKSRPGVVPYDVWEYNLVKNVSADKTSWPNQIPVTLVERIVKVSCPPNGIVCDPFMGSGTTAVAATKNDCRWIGFDIMVESKTETEKRVGAL